MPRSPAPPPGWHGAIAVSAPGRDRERPARDVPADAGTSRREHNGAIDVTAAGRAREAPGRDVPADAGTSCREHNGSIVVSAAGRAREASARDVPAVADAPAVKRTAGRPAVSATSPSAGDTGTAPTSSMPRPTPASPAQPPTDIALAGKDQQQPRADKAPQCRDAQQHRSEVPGAARPVSRVCVTQSRSSPSCRGRPNPSLHGRNGLSRDEQDCRCHQHDGGERANNDGYYRLAASDRHKLDARSLMRSASAALSSEAVTMSSRSCT